MKTQLISIVGASLVLGSVSLAQETSPAGAVWVYLENGNLPSLPAVQLPTGTENGKSLVICRVHAEMKKNESALSLSVPVPPAPGLPLPSSVKVFEVAKEATYYGVHPGKVTGSNCNISYNGKELTFNKYEALTIPTAKFSWVSGKSGLIPPNAVAAGDEEVKGGTKRTLYVCRGNHKGGQHPGKVVSQKCNIGYGGKEVQTTDYEVLTIP